MAPPCVPLNYSPIAQVYKQDRLKFLSGTAYASLFLCPNKGGIMFDKTVNKLSKMVKGMQKKIAARKQSRKDSQGKSDYSGSSYNGPGNVDHEKTNSNMGQRNY